MPEKTLHFQSPRHLSLLYCSDERLLRHAEKVLGVDLVTRDDWIKAEAADPETIERTEQLFEALNFARSNGVNMREVDFRNFVAEVAEGRGGPLVETFREPIVIKLKNKSVVPKTVGQQQYLRAIEKRDVVFGIGPAGTGKTYLAVAAALDALLAGRVERIILTRPAVEAGEALGFLPGDLTEKILPYLTPLYDAIYTMVGKEFASRLIEKATIEVAPLAYMRGRTLSEAFIILDEAQNTTAQQMMMFLTRLGEGSRMVITGDVTQTDLPRSKTSGLVQAQRILRDVKGIDIHRFSAADVVRHPLVQRIIAAYDQHYQQIEVADSGEETPGR